MKEVKGMDARVIGYPTHTRAWIVECSEHGFITVADEMTVDFVLASHMTEHGARVPS